MLRSAAATVCWAWALALTLGVSACGDDASRAADTSPEDTSDAVDTLVPDTSPEDTWDAVDTLDAAEDTWDAVDTVPTDTLYDPLASVDPTPPYLPDDPAPSAPRACLPVVNPDAETGNLDGWTVAEGSFKAQKETSIFAGNYPEPYEGTYYFRAGDSGRSRLVQTVPLDTLADPTGEALRVAVFSLHLRDHNGNDEAWFSLAALDADGATLAAREQGPFTDDRWRYAEVALALPPGTVAVRIQLDGRRTKGDANDAYFDDVALCVYDTPPRADLGTLHAPPYLMNVTETAVTVMFETRRPTVARVDYGPDADHLDRSVSEPTPVTTHQLRLTDLAPGARSVYRLSWDDVSLPPYDFRTAAPADDDGRVEFVVVSDNQDGPGVFAALAEQMAAFDPDFVLHAGDCVQDGTRPEYRSQWFAPLFGLANHAAIVQGPGNHETYSSGIFTSNSARALWEEYVDQPGDEHCFGLRWGPLFVMVLDTERPHMVGSPQYTCIEAALTSDDAQTATFRVALFHRPPLIEWWDSVASFPSPITFFGGGMDAPDVRDDLAPLFEATGVQLVFNGHNHLYQYVPAWPETVAWVIAGGGGGGLESGVPESRVNDWSDVIARTVFHRHHFLRVILEEDVLAVEAIDLSGEVFDTFYVTP